MFVSYKNDLIFFSINTILFQDFIVVKTMYECVMELNSHTSSLMVNNNETKTIRIK